MMCRIVLYYIHVSADCTQIIPIRNDQRIRKGFNEIYPNEKKIRAYTQLVRDELVFTRVFHSMIQCEGCMAQYSFNFTRESHF